MWLMRMPRRFEMIRTPLFCQGCLIFRFVGCLDLVGEWMNHLGPSRVCAPDHPFFSPGCGIYSDLSEIRKAESFFFDKPEVVIFDLCLSPSVPHPFGIAQDPRWMAVD